MAQIMFRIIICIFLEMGVQWDGQEKKETRGKPKSNYCNYNKTGDQIRWKNTSFHQPKKKDLSVTGTFAPVRYIAGKLTFL